MAFDPKHHWEQTYTAQALDEVSWFEAAPDASLGMINAAELPPDAAIIDVGGGASHLAGELQRLGFTDITVADISAAALRAGAELGADSTAISFIEADVRNHDFGREFDLWHDRAVFHFMVEPDDRECYLSTLRASLRPGGYLVLATFGPEGPRQCSDLPVQRYGASEMREVIGEEFEPVLFQAHVHATPSGNEQHFQYALFRRLARARRQHQRAGFDPPAGDPRGRDLADRLGRRTMGTARQLPNPVKDRGENGP